jgi:glycosyltransferase involved in cell wall biosynthesis
VFPPLVAGGAARMGQFARLLPDHGWDVTVVTGRPAAASAVDRAGAAEIAARAQIVEARSPSSIVVKRGQSVAKHGVRGMLRRAVRGAALSVVFPDREVFWVGPAIKAARRVMKQTRHDVVLASYGPASNLLVGRALAAAFRLPFVVDFRDLWSTLPMPVFPTRLHRAAAHRLEHSIVSRASRLLAVAPAMARDLALEHGIEADRAVSITNGFDPADSTRVRDERPSGPRPFRLMYTGTVHVHYNLEPLWRALRTLANSGEITPAVMRVEFVGNLATSEVSRHGLDELVDISPFVPHEEVFAAFARADALLVVETPGYYARYGYAAKVFDYVLTGKPVVGLVDIGGNTETLLRAAGVGHCVAPDDEAGLVRMLREIIKLKGAAPKHVDPDAPPLRDFNRTHLVRRLAQVLDDVADSEPRGRW